MNRSGDGCPYLILRLIIYVSMNSNFDLCIMGAREKERSSFDVLNSLQNLVRDLSHSLTEKLITFAAWVLFG